MAGERDGLPLPDGKAMLARDPHLARPAPGRRAPAPKPSGFVRLDYAGVQAGRPHAQIDLPREQAPLASRFAYAELRTLPSWRLTAALPQVTSTRGGDWAVRDTLADYRKPRFRRSALGTMLVLRIDGQEESPAFSVGGGGVAAALWKAVPGN